MKKLLGIVLNTVIKAVLTGLKPKTTQENTLMFRKILNKLYKTQVICLFVILFTAFPCSLLANNFSLEQAVKRVEKQQQGRVISAKTQPDQRDRNIHNVRILTPKGQVKRYRINERNGQYVRPLRKRPEH